ncbi:MAG TPA: DUF4440 domain-containing protein [Kofleriaceae bacterium]|jgi:SAM-dependent methyltransferase
MRLIGVVVVVGCAHAPPASETLIRDRSHGVIEAFDRGDAATLRAALAPGFVHFEGETPLTRDDELAKLAKRKPDAFHIATRTWRDEHVFVHGDSAVFVGGAHEHADGNYGGFDYDGWYTLAWRREGAAWRLGVWTWQRDGAERDAWNDTFRNGTGFNKEPNQLLAQTIAGVTPGRALDVMMGQGRNALLLAAHGWQVTGVDWSAEGIRVARDTAAQRHLALDAVYADVDKFDFGVERWDLVTMIYAGDDPARVAKLAKSLVHGGLFVVEFFHDNDTPGVLDGSFARGELAKLVGDGFEIVRDEVVDGVPDWGKPHGSLVRFVARKK